MHSQYNENEKAKSGSHRGRVRSCPLGGCRSPVIKHLPEGSSPSSRAGSLLCSALRATHVAHHSSQGALFIPSTNIYSFIKSKRLCAARQQVLLSSHMQSPLKMLLHTPKPSYLRSRASGKQFHIPSAWPPSSTERMKTQGCLFTDFFWRCPIY